MSQIIVEKVSKSRSGQINDKIMFRLKNMKTEKTFDHVHGKWDERNTFGSMVFVPNEYQYIDHETGDLLYKRFVKKIEKNPITGYDNPVPDTIIFEETSDGLLVCDLNTPRGKSMYDFLVTHPNNGSNPHRDTSAKIIFYQVDNAKEAEEKVNETVGYKEAMIKAFELDFAGLKMYSRLIGQSVKGKTEAELRVVATEKAMEDPKKFFAVLNDRDGLIKANVSEAEDLGIIVFDNSAGSWSWESGTLIKTFPLNKPKYDGICEYFSTKAGAITYAKMCELIDNNKTN